jgi:O-antigen/teichoic acid export membrane protein
MWNRIRSLFFENRTSRQTIAKNAFWLGFSNVGGRLLRAAVLIYAARVLEVAEWGAFSYAFSLIAFFTILTDMGLNTFLVRENVRAEDAAYKEKVASTIFYLKLGLSGICLAFIIGATPWLTKLENARMILPLVAFVMVFDTLRDFGFAVIRAKEKMEWETGLFLFTNLAIVVFGFAALLFRPGLVPFTLAYAAGTGVGMLATLFAVRKGFGWVTGHFSAELIRPIFRASWPFALTGLLGGLMINTDVIVIGYFGNAEQVGYYSAVLRIVTLLYLIPSILAISILPVLSRVAKTDQAIARRVVETILRALTLIAVPLMAGGVLLAEPIVAFVFGAQYLPSVLSFQLLLCTIFFNFTAMFMTTCLFAYDEQDKLITYSLIGALANVALDIILIPMLGIAGSALATLIVQIITFFYAISVLKRSLPFRFLQGAGSVVFGTMGMITSVLLLQNAGAPVLANILVSAAVYGSILLLLKEALFKELYSVLRNS